MKVTLTTLPEATAQDVFNQVATHLVQQRERSVAKLNNEDGLTDCAYRGERGLQCAAGCLIGDDEYHSELEGYHWMKLVAIGTVPDVHVELITRLQKLHDHCGYAPKDWPVLLEEVATDFGLSAKVLSCTATDTHTAED